MYDLAAPDPVFVWVTFPDRSLEVEGRVKAYTEQLTADKMKRGRRR
ncbi:hypothetical protein EDF64_11118 [Curtobacterium flaccumfaciens]|uniref:Uncharacterized protein n=1 Tax=Curtobacterium flaccumfaciens TaxID=2035 RepID=A0A4R6DDP3_9MICO|nr:hypothetical protein [Curtobacterium flaccumfaciens]TDN42543.1 hypothetical protein EDF64_11118 [Curtobacterium flaccumfaciens]